MKRTVFCKFILRLYRRHQNIEAKFSINKILRNIDTSHSCLFLCWFIRSLFTLSFLPFFLPSFVLSFVHLFVHLFICSFIHLFLKHRPTVEKIAQPISLFNAEKNASRVDAVYRTNRAIVKLAFCLLFQ